MQISALKGKKVGIVGFGVEGRGLASFFDSKGINYVVFDSNELLKNDPSYSSARFFLGPDALNEVKACDVVFRSPGIRLDAELIRVAREAGAEISSQLNLFFENNKAKIIGITGTKGKSTTSKLTYEILKTAGFNVFLGGNFGNAVIELTDTLTSKDYVVLELSSFQLQDLKYSPEIAVVLAINADHLDYHKNEAEYVEAKAAITAYQNDFDVAVINFDSANARKVGERGEAKKYFVHSHLTDDSHDFANGFVAEKETNKLVLVEEGGVQDYLLASELALRGFHNLQNVASAVLVARSLGVSDTVIKEVLRSYKGLEHRLEFVTEKKGVKFYNDSISTTPESALAAIRSFPEPKILIMGGSSKGVDYVGLGRQVAKEDNVKSVVLLGEVTPELKQGLSEQNFSGQIFEGAQDMEQAFAQIKSVASRGDVVVLAPGTASFDMFVSYKERGNKFKQEAEHFDE
jgi:UDP-N-acetylmuramoylalanine--D-glutamate ligase